MAPVTTPLNVGDYVRPVDEQTRGIIRRIDRGIYYVELEGDSDLHRYSHRELRLMKRMPSTASKRLPDGTLLNVSVHGSPKVK